LAPQVLPLIRFKVEFGRMSGTVRHSLEKLVGEPIDVPRPYLASPDMHPITGFS